MYTKLQKPLALVGVLGLILIGGNYTRLYGDDLLLLAASRSTEVKLPEMDVEISRSWNPDEISFEAEKVPNLGAVVWARASGKAMLSPCYLGAYYLIPKKTIGNLESEGFSITSTLVTALSSDNHLSVRAREFKDAFLIFEPNKKSCPGNIFSQKREVELRERLWEAVSTASIL